MFKTVSEMQRILSVDRQRLRKWLQRLGTGRPCDQTAQWLSVASPTNISNNHTLIHLILIFLYILLIIIFLYLLLPSSFSSFSHLITFLYLLLIITFFYLLLLSILIISFLFLLLPLTSQSTQEIRIV